MLNEPFKQALRRVDADGDAAALDALAVRLRTEEGVRGLIEQFDVQ